MTTAHAPEVESPFDLPRVTLAQGAPIAVADILSPRDIYGDIHRRISSYHVHGVQLVWEVNSPDHTLTVYRPDARPRLFNEDQELTGDPHLPGFHAPVARLFG
jgi:Uma2 family endonuclease